MNLFQGWARSKPWNVFMDGGMTLNGKYVQKGV